MGEIADYSDDHGDSLDEDGEAMVDVSDDLTYWVTKAGQAIRIGKMDDKHLNNTIAMLERRGAAAQLAVKEKRPTLIDATETKMLVKMDDRTLDRYKNMLQERTSREATAKAKGALVDVAARLEALKQKGTFR